MDKFYNTYYSYPDLFLWNEKTWEPRKNKMAPIVSEIRKILTGKLDTAVDHYVERNDEIIVGANRSPVFPDVVEEWKKKGMVFSSYGMMGNLMAPVAVENHEIYDPKVLFVPVVTKWGDPHAAMNLLYDYSDLLEKAAKENILVQFVDCGRMDGGGLLELGIETQGTFRISYDPVYLDISVLEENNISLNSIEGLNLAEWSEPFELAGRKVIDITDKWQANVAHQPSITRMYKRIHPDWNYDRHFKTMGGKRQAEAIHMEYDYKNPHDPKMTEFWNEKGLVYEDHYTGHDWWVTLSPKSWQDNKEHKLPLFIIMKEPRTACPSMMQTAFQFYYDHIELCAHGEFMIMFFALETPWDTDEVLPGIIEECVSQYNVDRTRIYLTGQSHNGSYALDFYRKHPKLIAACAQLCDPVGLQAGARIDYYKSDAENIVKDFREYDYPTIVINGEIENSYRNPNRTPEKIEEDIFYFQNRLKAYHIPMKSREEIIGALNSDDYVTRKNGVPADKTDLRYYMGKECYVSDYKNENGKWHFRYISMENTPHMIMPQMAELSWEFIKRFARDPETGESIELY